MVGLKRKDISKDILMMFALSYEYSLSFTNLLKLFAISKQYFWTFMEICSPMLKMGVRKASMLRRSVEKILPYVTDEGEKEELTLREDNILEKFKWFVEESFSNGEDCLTIEQLKEFAFARGYSDTDMCITYDFESLKNNVDRIKYVQIGDEKFFKTSMAMFYVEKFCGDMDYYQINNLSVRDIIRKIEDGEYNLEEQQKELC